MKVTIYRGIGKLTVCPNCSGAMHLREALYLECFDCRAVFKVVGPGPTDNNMVYEEVQCSEAFG